MLAKGKEAREKVNTSFPLLTAVQLNWKPDEDSWSIGQCLDHLVIADCCYFPVFKKIAAGNFKMRSWERWNPLNRLFGKVMISYIQEKPRRKLTAPKIFRPADDPVDAGIIERFHKHLDTLLDCITLYEKVDVDKTHISSPVSGLITYSLRNAIILVIQHEHRHINQAIRIKLAKDFPKSEEPA